MLEYLFRVMAEQYINDFLFRVRSGELNFREFILIGVTEKYITECSF
jgi:hypothetical protein